MSEPTTAGPTTAGPTTAGPTTAGCEGSESNPRVRPQREHRGPVEGPIVLVLSSHAGNAASADDVARALKAVGIAVGERMPVTELDATRTLGARWRNRGIRAAIAAGGDGTVGAVASQLADAGLPLGILPMGTSNDTARSLGIPLDLDQAAQVIASGHTRPFDAGQAVPALTATPVLSEEQSTVAQVAAVEASAAPIGAYFLHALTLGFNVQFARLATDIARRERLRSLNYAASLVEAIATFRPTEVTLRFSGLVEPAELDPYEVVQSQVLEVAAVNTPVFGGAMNLRVPEVELHDRLLDFVIFESLDAHSLRLMIEDAVSALARLPDGLLGRFASQQLHQATGDESGAAMGQASGSGALDLAMRGIRRFKAREAVIESEQPLAVTLDGEVRAKTPVLVRVAPQPVHIFVPATAQ